MSLEVLTHGGGGGESASIFITGLSESDVVTATKDGKTVNGKWNSTASRFEVTKIKEYGMWTVTATNGDKTTTQDVLVDAAVEYEIEMVYILFLYREGDECEEITGGWVTDGYSYEGYNFNAPTRNSNSIYYNLPQTYGYTQGLGTANKIDLTGYSKLKMRGMRTNGAYHPTLLCDSSKAMSGYSGTAMVGAGTTSVNNTVVTCEINISNTNGYYYIAVEADAGRPSNETRRGYVYDVWLE